MFVPAVVVSVVVAVFVFAVVLLLSFRVFIVACLGAKRLVCGRVVTMHYSLIIVPGRVCR